MSLPCPLPQLDLHYSVNCDRASAKFDKSTHILTVTLPVIPSTPPPTTLLPPESPPSEGEGLQEDEDHSSPDERREMEGTYGMYCKTHTCTHTRTHARTRTHMVAL